MSRGLRNTIKRALLAVHKIGIRCGLYIMPAHYYVNVPNILELRKTRDIWAKKSDLPGIDTDLDEQVAALAQYVEPFCDEYAGNKTYKDGVAGGWGPGYGYLEAQALHGVIRHLKPKRVIEVGAGVSTLCMLTALDKNKEESGQDYEYTCIEPYPSEMLLKEKRINLLHKPVQVVPFEVFENLQEGDFLFIDSSHTVRAGGDVNFLFLEAIPRLASGVTIHVHDITFPYDYDRGTLNQFMHWSESSLLRALLINSTRMKIIFSMSMLHYDRQDVLKRVFPEYIPAAEKDGLVLEGTPTFNSAPTTHFPSSIYLHS